MITCKDAHRLLIQRQDRPLGWRQRWSLRLHLAICQACRRFSGQVDLLRQAVRRYGRLD